jgi:predicted deacylase
MAQQFDPTTRYRWPHGAVWSDDLVAFHRQLDAVAAAGGWTVEELGPVLEHRLPLLHRAAGSPSAPSLLIASGFHGEEAAGPWGVLAFLQALDTALANRVHLTLLPLVNASGFALGQRFNTLGQNPNRGYLPIDAAFKPPIEGQRLLAQRKRLVAAGRDGVLSCHEDVKTPHSYVYAFEPRSAPGAFSQALARTAAEHFTLHPDGAVDDAHIAAGVVFNHHDGSFESWLASEGVAVAACIETPGQEDFTRRVAAQAALMRRFVEQRVEQQVETFSR